MPANFRAQPNAPLIDEKDYASQPLASYFNQFDLVEQNRLIGRGAGAGVGPFQWLTLGAGLVLDETELSVDGFADLGDVIGPDSAVSGNLASYNGVTGKVIADSSVLSAWFNQAVLTTSSPTFAGVTTTALSVNGFAVTVSGVTTLNDWFNQSVKTTASPTFNGLTATSLTVNGFLVTVNGVATLNNWFDQSVKAAASPTFAGLTVNGFALTVSGAPTLNDWFDQSVKTTASPTFDALTVTNAALCGSVDASEFFVSGTPGVDFSGSVSAITVVKGIVTAAS